MKQLLVVAAVVLLTVSSGCAGLGALGEQPSWGFEDVTSESGLDYTAQASTIGNGNSGVYAADYNNDGWTDVLATGGDQPGLFRNVNGTFERVQRFPEISGTVQGAVFFDANDDGWEDLLLLRRYEEAVFLRNDQGSFSPHENGLGEKFEVPVGASVADFNDDGRLDVFVAQYGDWGSGTPKGYYKSSGSVEEDNGNPNQLFRNTGDGFERVNETSITGNHWSLATSFTDLTGDGKPDVYVANDFANDTLYVNTGGGSFDRVVMGGKTARNGMSTEIGFFNDDARPDVFVTNIFFPLDKADLDKERYQRLQRYFSFVLHSKRVKGNNLLINQGNGSFSFEAGTYGVKKGGWGWAAVHDDLNNDMQSDLFQATQYVFRVNQSDPHYTYPMVWTGTDGKQFESRDASDLGFNETNGRGVAELDYNRDGAMDLIVATYDSDFHVYENNAAKTLDDRHSVQIRAVTSNGESTAIGANVELVVNGTTQYARENAQVDFQSQDTRVLHFGLGEHDQVDRIKIVWPDGTTQVLRNVSADQRITVQPDGTTEKTSLDS